MWHQRMRNIILCWILKRFEASHTWKWLEMLKHARTCSKMLQNTRSGLKLRVWHTWPSRELYLLLIPNMYAVCMYIYNYIWWKNITPFNRLLPRPYDPGSAHACKIRAVSRKSFSSLTMSFGKRPDMVEQIKLTKLAKLIRSNTYRTLRGILWSAFSPDARTTVSLSSSWSTWSAPGSALPSQKGGHFFFANHTGSCNPNIIIPHPLISRLVKISSMMMILWYSLSVD